MAENVPVLIVGAGYAGLAAAVFLAHHGVPAVLVDRHPGISIQGRARGINQRTLEIYRPLGLAEPIRAAGRPFDGEAGVVRCETLAGEWTWVLDDATRGPLPDLTACEFGMADQASVEPILIDAARAGGADIRFDTQCLSVEAGPDAVTAEIMYRATGERATVRADYLIAADGFRGGIGPGLGLVKDGPGVTQSWVTFVIGADLEEIVPRRAMFWIVVNPEIGFGSLLTTSTPGRWALSFSYDPATDSPADFTPERCAKAARAIIGRDLPVEILDIACWDEAVGVAERFRAGRVFLAGDSAHTWPPAGAMGANAAVQDAHNLAWKLAGVINGWAGEGLLDTYEAERRPVARALADITVRRQRARFGEAPEGDDVDDILCTFGQRYRSAAVIGATHGGGYAPGLASQAVPGARAPHLWLDGHSERISVHDLFHDSLVLLTGAADGGWRAAAQQVARRTGVPLSAHRIGPATAGAEFVDAEDVWETRYRLGPLEAVLVRPDGYVAWRGCAAAGDQVAVLSEVLSEVLATLVQAPAEALRSVPRS